MQHLRRAPSQGRSRETFTSILDWTAELLDEVGVDAFTTNLLSERSGIAVRAIYRYFPNKHAIIVELARRMAAGWHEYLDDDHSMADAATDWRALWRGYIDGFVRAFRSTPGALAILHALRADPDLRAIDDQANDAYIRDVTLVLLGRSPGITRASADAVAHVLVTSTIGVLEGALEAPPARSARIIEMLKEMHIALLERYLED